MRPPVYGDAFECTDTKAVFSVVGVRQASKGAGGKDFDKPRWEIAMVCVVGPDPNVRLAGGGPTLGDMHHVGGTWASLQDSYTLLTA